jgi:hypothetical protein
MISLNVRGIGQPSLNVRTTFGWLGGRPMLRGDTFRDFFPSHRLSASGVHLAVNSPPPIYTRRLLRGLRANSHVDFAAMIQKFNLGSKASEIGLRIAN